MYMNGAGNISKSMNGLLKISASEVNATNASITNLNDIQNINGAIGSDLVIDVDTGKKIQLKDDTQIDTNLNVIGNFDVSGATTLKQLTVSQPAIFNGSVATNSTFIAKSIDASNTSVFRSNLNVLGPINCTQNVTFDKDLILTSSANQLSVFCSSSTFDGSLNVKGVLDVTRNSIFRNNLDVSANLYVGKNNPNTTSNIEVTGEMIIRAPSNPSITYMRIFYLPAGAGFRFINEQANGYMYFSVKDGAGNIRNFQFSSGQLYSNIFTYIDNGLNISYNNQLTLGDSNGAGTWFGVSHKYIPNPSSSTGYVVYNKGLNNGVEYFTNFTHNNLSNVETPTLRMSYANIWSKVPHTMESTLTLSGNLIANATNITPTQLSYLSGVTSSIQTQLNNKLDLTTGGTLTGNLIVNSTTITPVQLSYLNGVSSNIQTQLNNKLDLTGGTISGNITISGTTTLNAQLNLNDNLFVSSTTILPVHLSYLAGASSNLQTQLNGKLNSLGTTLSGNLTFADATIQSTAYTTADDTKLSAIGGITTSTLAGNTNLVTGTIFSCGSFSLSPGTYLISINIFLDVITGTTTINAMAAAFSTSATAFTQAIGAREDGGGFIWPVASGWSLNSTNPLVVSTTTVYYALVRATFGTAGRLRFLNGNSAFTATRIG